VGPLYCKGFQAIEALYIFIFRHHCNTKRAYYYWA